MLALVQTAEQLGYRIVAVSTGSITLVPPGTRDIEVIISGRLVDAETLRRLLVPLGREGVSKRPHPEAHRVEVEWADSTIPHEGWIRHADVMNPRYRNKMVRCLSVGLLLADDKHGVALASSAHRADVAGVTIIPRGQVLKLRRLR